MIKQQHDKNQHKLIERFNGSTREIVSEVLAHESLTRDWRRAWCVVADVRLELADAHLAAAVSLQEGFSDPVDRSVKRAVISRAYYAMYCAARAAVSLETEGDVNDHTKLPLILNATTGLRPDDDRSTVATALRKFRMLRNEADYSAYYPASFEDDACAAVAEAKKVFCICHGWATAIRQKRGLI